MTETFDPTTIRAGRRRNNNWVRVLPLSLVVTWSFLLQACLAGAWVALVSVDSMTSSNVTLGPFEQSWVAPKDQLSDAVKNLKVTSITVLPVEGDPEMGARLAILLQQETAIRVEVPTSIAAGVAEADPRLAKADEADRSTLAREITRNLGVDTVLVSRVVAELPFTLVKGLTPPLEASVQTDLSDHVMQHVKELRLDELGYLPKKAVYRIPKKVSTLTR